MQSIDYIQVVRAKTVFMRSAFCLAMLVLLVGCAGRGGGFGSIEKTGQLRSGMKPDEVRAIFGEPANTQLISEKLVWKYSLHQVWKGYVPYYLVFGRKSQALEQWFADEKEYQAQQEYWLKAIGTAQPTQPQTKKQGQSSAQTDCERQYKYHEDRLCYCHNLCNSLR